MPALDGYLVELEVLDAAFARARGVLGEGVPCRKGCSSCCVAVFDVHPADAHVLGLWLDELDRPRRAEVLARSRAVTGQVAAAARRLAGLGREGLRDWAPLDGFATLSAADVTALAEQVSASCPVLDEAGSCGAHASRPSLCRLQGVPWRDARSGAELPDFCRLDPRQELNEPQPIDLTALDAARHEAREALSAGAEGRVLPGRTFVAAALVRWDLASG